MISIDAAKAAVSGYLEAHAADLGRYVIQAISLWVKNRKHAERVIQEAHDSYTREFADIEAHMRGDGADR